eukprot:TRINITY_DN1607_c0_g1_i3.p1 TRINITY_DN1607_c0_g1~~TRINITY_DN1607_c0_g1_i3.p1  ORF type:complete len:609 (+),score=122.53 TRINITY_DN1607_c0_g1_i3:372-2198(+)
MMVAAMFNMLNSVQALVEAGADIDCVNNEGRNAIQQSIWWNKPGNPVALYLAKVKAAKDKAEAEKAAKEKEKAAKEKAEAEKAAKEKAEAEKTAKDKAEAEKMAREQADKEKNAIIFAFAAVGLIFGVILFFRRKSRVKNHDSMPLVERYRGFLKISESSLIFPTPRVILGRGSTASVEMAHLRGMPVAVKIFHSSTELGELQLKKELAVLEHVLSPCCVVVLGFSTQPAMLVMELCPEGSWDQFRAAVAGKQRAMPSFPELLVVARDLFQGMADLHCESRRPGVGRVLHRDVKGANLMVFTEETRLSGAKIVDFGLSTIASSIINSSSSFEHLQGTPGYMAPELFGDSPKQSLQTDIYAAAVTLNEILSFSAPYAHLDIKPVQIALQVVRGSRPTVHFVDSVPEEFRGELLELIEIGWHALPESRPTASYVVSALNNILGRVLGSGSPNFRNSVSPEFDVFISYCWLNSEAACAPAAPRGSTDPRRLAEHLRDGGLRTFLDVWHLNGENLFEQLASALKKSRMVLICVSSEYADSVNCKRELEFAIRTLKRPYVVAVVGTPESAQQWLETGVGMTLRTPVWVDFSQGCTDHLLSLLTSYVRRSLNLQ